MRTAAKLTLTVLLALGTAPIAISSYAQTAPGPGAVAFPGETPRSTETAAPVATAKVVEKEKPKSIDTVVAPSDPNKVPESVKNVLDKMDKVSEDVTLEDLNSAREAIAKLDVLIDIEKRLTDLAGIRKEREEKSMTAVANALPRNSYAPPPVLGGTPASYGLPASIPSEPTNFDAPVLKPVAMGPTKIDVLKIVGAEGRYTAYVKDSEEAKGKQIHQGDKMSDGSIVSSISRSGVALTKGSKTSTFQVKDVAKVFSGR